MSLIQLPKLVAVLLLRSKIMELANLVVATVSHAVLQLVKYVIMDTTLVLVTV